MELVGVFVFKLGVRVRVRVIIGEVEVIVSDVSRHHGPSFEELL